MSECSFEIVREIATLSNTKTTAKKLTLTNWNSRGEKLDLRSWRTDENGQQQPSRGITLSDDEAAALVEALFEYLKNRKD